MMNKGVIGIRVKKIGIGAMAATTVIAAIFLCWWKGLFLPNWIDWERKEFTYETAQLQLQNRRLSLFLEDAEGGLSPVYQTAWDWCVQDVLTYDINQDGQEELILLVWKHGSYGEHRPFWVKHNDIRLEQHIFIYQWDETRAARLRPIWMSSALGYQVTQIARGTKESLVVTDRTGESKVWQWQGFGLKLAGRAEERKVQMLCAGDNLIHPWILQYANGRYDYFYEHLTEKIQQADVASVNQETIFVKESGLVSDYPRFGTPIEVGDAIAAAGFDLVTLATNHVLDQDLYGIKVTAAFYQEKDGMTYIGIHPPEEAAMTPAQAVKIMEVNGIRLALLNATYGTNGRPSPEESPYVVERFREEERLVAQLDYAREHADAVIVFAHWGTEYSAEPDEEQQYLCRLFLEHGVDAVVGTHPHVLQPMEWLEGKDGHRMLVYYSLGNLISGQDRVECMVGGLADFTVVKSAAGEVSIENSTLEPVVTHQNDSTCTTYLLEDYTEELAEEHRLAGMKDYLDGVKEKWGRK